MKKFFSILAIFLLMSPVCFAADMKVLALEDFSTDSPSEIKVLLLQDISLDENLELKGGYIITGEMIDIIPAKRLKRDATFSFKPTSYKDLDDEVYTLNKEYIGKFLPKIEIDKTMLIKNAALTVGSFFLKGVSLGYYAVEGAVKNQKSNRFVSSINNIYENSPVSYIEKGGATYIKKNSMFTLKFDSPNNISE